MIVGMGMAITTVILYLNCCFFTTVNAAMNEAADQNKVFVRDRTITTNQAIDYALGLLQERRFEELEQVIKQVLSFCDTDEDGCISALQLLAFMEIEKNNLGAAEKHLKDAVSRPQGNISPRIWSNLGEVQRRYTGPTRAISTLAEAWNMFKNERLDVNESELAELAYNLGIAYNEDLQDHLALEMFDRALSLNANYLNAIVSIARILEKRASSVKAAQEFSKRLAQADLEAIPCVYYKEAAIYWHRGSKGKEAEDAYRKALNCLDRQLAPGEPEAYQAQELRGLVIGNIGTIRHNSGELDVALEFYEQALKYPGRKSSLLSNAGACLYYLGQFEKAREYLEASLREDPSRGEAHVNLAISYYRVGDLERAEQHYLAARNGREAMMDARIALMTYSIMPDSKSFEELANMTVHKLENWIKTLSQTHSFIKNPTSEIEWLPFFWTYYGLNEYGRQGIVSHAYSQIAYASPGPARPGPNRNIHEPIYVGFISKFWHENHAHGQLLAGVLKELARDPRFEPRVVYVYSVGAPPSEEVIQAVGQERIVTVSMDTTQLREDVRALNLDILIFADTMSEPITHFLARERLALVQGAFWGNPVTSGSPQMDFFISGDTMEPEESAEPHYHEQVVRLRGQAIHYNDIPVPEEVRSYLHSRPKCPRKVIFATLQSSFKLHPAFDRALKNILDRVPEAELLLLDARLKEWTEQLKARLSKVLGEDTVKRRVKFVSRVSSSDEYLKQLSRADVVLHPFPFGGSKTSADALLLGLPLVTMDGAYLRGRMAASFLRKMEMSDLLPRNAKEYVDLAVRLAKDCEFRKIVAERTLQQVPNIFNDRQTLDEWKNFLARSASQARLDLSLASADTHPSDPSVEDSISKNHYDQGRNVDARQHAERQLELHPNALLEKMDLGCILYTEGELYPAYIHLRESIELDPSSSLAHNNLAKVAQQLGLVDEAEFYYKAAILLDPTFPSALYSLAFMYMSSDRSPEIVKMYTRALGLSPSTRSSEELISLHQMSGVQLCLLDLSIQSMQLLGHGLIKVPVSHEEQLRLRLNAAYFSLFIGSHVIDVTEQYYRFVAEHRQAGLGPSLLRDADLPKQIKFALIVQYYEPRGPNADDRLKELQRCIRANVESGAFDEVHILLESSPTVPIFPPETQFYAEVKHVVLGRRLMFSDAIHYANDNLQGKVCVLANADIMYDSTIRRLELLLPENGNDSSSGKVIAALTRWQPSNSSKEWVFWNRIDSQDTWAWRPPLHVKTNANFFMGIPRCDNHLAYILESSGHIVRNFALDIVTRHIHADKSRPAIPDVNGAGSFVPFSLPRFPKIV